MAEEGILVITVRAAVNPDTTNPQEIAEYFLDPDCDDPPCEYINARWLNDWEVDGNG